MKIHPTKMNQGRSQKKIKTEKCEEDDGNTIKEEDEDLSQSLEFGVQIMIMFDVFQRKIIFVNSNGIIPSVFYTYLQMASKTQISTHTKFMYELLFYEHDTPTSSSREDKIKRYTHEYNIRGLNDMSMKFLTNVVHTFDPSQWKTCEWDKWNDYMVTNGCPPAIMFYFRDF